MTEAILSALYHYPHANVYPPLYSVSKLCTKKNQRARLCGNLKSFRYKGAKVWNEVCDLSKDCRTLSDSKAGLVKWEGVKCSCNDIFKLALLKRLASCARTSYCNVFSTISAGMTPHLSSITMSLATHHLTSHIIHPPLVGQ